MTSVLARIERTNLILGLALTFLGGILWGAQGMAGAAAGAVLGCADFYLLRRLGARAIAKVRAGGSPWNLGFALMGKMAGLFALVFVAIKVVHLAVLPFALGFSVFVISIFTVGMAAARSEAEI